MLLFINDIYMMIILYASGLQSGDRAKSARLQRLPQVCYIYAPPPHLYVAPDQFVSSDVWPGTVLSRCLARRVRCGQGVSLAGSGVVKVSRSPGPVLSRCLARRVRCGQGVSLAGSGVVKVSRSPGLGLSRCLARRVRGYQGAISEPWNACGEKNRRVCSWT